MWAACWLWSVSVHTAACVHCHNLVGSCLDNQARMIRDSAFMSWYRTVYRMPHCVPHAAALCCLLTAADVSDLLQPLLSEADTQSILENDRVVHEDQRAESPETVSPASNDCGTRCTLESPDLILHLGKLRVQAAPKHLSKQHFNGPYQC